MAMLRPTLAFDFADTPALDPRISFTRASIASYSGRDGVLRYRPVNTPRFWFSSDDGSALGLLCEEAATNLLLYSEAFDNAAWTKTACTASPNATASPDGATAGDIITATGITASVAQTATFTSGQCLVFSIFAKPTTNNNYISLGLTSGGSTVTAWFNLVSGTTGSNVLAGPAGVITFAASSMRKWFGGWYRCALIVSTAGITSVTASFAPCYLDLGNPASGNAVAVWGAMLAQGGSSQQNTRLTSYIATTSATVTRAAENCLLPYSALASDQFGWLPDGGAFFIDFTLQDGVGASSSMICGLSTASNSYIMLGISMNASDTNTLITLQANCIGGGVVGASVADSITFTPEASIRAVFRYATTTSLDLCVNARPLVKSSTAPNVLPSFPPGGLEFGSGALGAAGPPVLVARAAHYVRRLTDAQMQQLTA
jgi:hypothetical protein